MPAERKTPAPAAVAPAVVFGSALLVTGVLLIVGNFWNGLSMDKLWPLFLLIPVLFFIMALVREGRKAAGVLIPGVILVVLTVYFLILNFTSWDLASSTWPVYILSPALAFFAFYLVTRDKPILIPAFILTAVAIACFGISLKSAVAVAVVLIAAGILLLVRSFWPPKQQKTPGEKP